MPFEEPSDLIKKAQIGFRQDAGLSHYSQTLKTVKNSNSAFEIESSSHYVKCMHCKGNLLRGSRSMICIYCGQCQAYDLPPQPILFNSTTSYRLLLQSLELFDSERTGNFFEEDRRNKKGTPVAEGIALGELLDVKIKWREDVEAGFVNKTFDYSSLFDFTTGDTSQTDTASEEEPSVSGKNDQTDGFGDHDNLSMFQSDEPLETSTISSTPNGSGRDSLLHSDSFTTENEDLRTNVTRNSLSGDDTVRLSLNSGSLNEDSETAAVSSDLRDDSSFGHDEEIQLVNSRMENADAKANVSISSDFKRDSSSEDVKEIQSVNLRSGNDDSKAAAVSPDFSGNLSVELDSEIQSVKSTTQDEDSETVVALPNFSRDSSFRADKEIQSENVRIQNEDSKTTVVSSDLVDHCSSGHDEDIQSVETRTEVTIPDVSSNLKDPSSSGRDSEIQSMKAVTQDEDSKTDSRRNSSCGDDTEIQSVGGVRMPNEDFKTDDVSSDLKGHLPPGRDEKIQSTRGNKGSDITDASSGSNDHSSSGGDPVIQFVKIDDEASKNDQSGALGDQDNQRLSQNDAQPEVSAESSDFIVPGRDVEIQCVRRSKSSKTGDVCSDSKDLSSSEGDTVTQSIRVLNEVSKNDQSDVLESQDDHNLLQNEAPPEISLKSSGFVVNPSSGDDAGIQNRNSRIEQEDFKTTVPVSSDLSRDSLFEDDTDISPVKSVNSGKKNEHSKAIATISTDFSRDSSSGDDAKGPIVSPRRQNKDSKNVVVSSDLSKDSSSGDDEKVSTVNSRRQNKDSKNVVLSSDMSKDSSSGDDAKVSTVNSTRQNKDSENVVSSDLSRDSSSGDDAKSPSMNSMSQNKESKIAGVSYDLSRDSSSGEDAKILSVDSRRNKDSKISGVSSDLSRDSSSGDDSRKLNKDSKIAGVSSDLSSSSGDDAKKLSMNSRRQHKGSKIVGVSSDFTRDSSSGDEAKIPFDDSRRQNENSNIAVLSSDFSRDSSSGDDAKIPFENYKRKNKDSKIALVSSDLRGDSSSGDDAEFQPVNSRIQNENSKTTSTIFSDLRNSETVVVSSNLHRESSSGDDAEIQSMKSTMQKEDSNMRGNSSSGDYAEVNDSKNTAASVDLKRDSSSGDDVETSTRTPNIDVSSDDAEIQPLNSKIQNKDSNTTAGVLSDLSGDISSGDEVDIQSVDLTTRNKEIKRRSSDLKDHSSSEDDADIQFVKKHNEDSKTIAGMSSDVSGDSSFSKAVESQSASPRSQNVYSETVLRRESSSGDDAEIQSVVNSRIQNEHSKDTVVLLSDLNVQTGSSSFRTRNEDSKTSATLSSDLIADSSYGDDTVIPPVNSSTRNDDSNVTTVSSNMSSHSSSGAEEEIRPENSNSKNDDFITDVVSSHLSRKSSSEDDTERQLVNSKMQNESSFKDDKEIQSVKSRMPKEDFKSTDPSVGSEANISGYMEDLMKEKQNSNLDPVQDDENQIKDEKLTVQSLGQIE